MIGGKTVERLMKESQAFVYNGSKFIMRNERIYFTESELASIKSQLNITAKKLTHKHKTTIISYALNKHRINNQRILKRGIITDELDGKVGFWYSAITTGEITADLLNNLEEEGLLEVSNTGKVHICNN